MSKEILFEAIRNGDEQGIEQYFIDNDRYRYGRYVKGSKYKLLHYAVVIQDYELAEFLVHSGAKINDGTPDNNDSPLHFASELGNLALSELLVYHNADVNTRSDDGATPLHYAASSGSLKVVQLLIDHQVDVNTRSNDGATPLHYAAANGRLKVVQLLIDHKADVNTRSNTGKTPLHSASRETEIDIVRSLLRNGADVNALDNNGRSCLNCAMDSDYQYPYALDTLKCLLYHGADIRPHLEILREFVAENGEEEDNDFVEISRYAAEFDELYSLFFAHNLNDFYIHRISSLDRRWAVYRKHYGEDVASQESFEAFVRDPSQSVIYNREQATKILSLPKEVLQSELGGSENLKKMNDNLFKWVELAFFNDGATESIQEKGVCKPKISSINKVLAINDITSCVIMEFVGGGLNKAIAEIFHNTVLPCLWSNAEKNAPGGECALYEPLCDGEDVTLSGGHQDDVGSEISG